MSTADKAAPAPAADPAAPAAAAAAAAPEEHKEDCACAEHKNPEPIYVTLNPNQEVTEIESLCMNCYKQGTTRLMFLKVCTYAHLLFFFAPPQLVFSSTLRQTDSLLQGAHRVGVQLPALRLRVEGRPVWRHDPASRCPLHPDPHQGCCLHIPNLSCVFCLPFCFHTSSTRTQDLNRTVVKSDSASVLIPSLEFEIPARTQRGCLNTVEGIIRNAADSLAADQDYRRQAQPEIAAKIQVVIDKLRALVAPLADDAKDAKKTEEGTKKEGEEEEEENKGPFPFVLVLDDPAGNSFVENPQAPSDDPQLDVAHYRRTKAQNEELCLNDTEDTEGTDARAEALEEEQRKQADAAERRAAEQREKEGYLALVPEHKNPAAITRGLEGDGAPEDEDHATVTQEQQVMVIPQDCPSCSAPGELRSVLTHIPHFKEVVIMAFTCDKCGYRSNEVHPGGAYTDHGTTVTLHAHTPADLSRSLLKSDTCTMKFPELELELGPGTLGSRFTTVEGMLDDILDSFLANPFIVGDSAESDQRARVERMTNTLKAYKTGTVPFTLTMDDPMSNSHIQNPLYPQPDPQLEVVTYKLSWEQKEEFGINNMRTEDDASGQYLAPQIPESSKASTAAAPASAAPASAAAPDASK